MADLLADRTAIVTGGGSGIGRAIAEAFAHAGAEVVIAGRAAERLRRTADELGPRVSPVVTDVTDEEAVRRLFAEVTRDGRGVDLLVNSAGAFAVAVVDDLTLEQWHTVMEVNVTGTFLCAREAFRHMRPRGGGRIINIGSIAGSRARAHSTAYAASKHAVWGLTQALALDGRDDGIAVCCLNPGNTSVERRADTVAAAGRAEGPEPMMPAAEVARTALLMATVPPEVNLLEATVLPLTQRYLGRG